MPKYMIQVPVSGWLSYAVDARDTEDAICVLDKDGGYFAGEFIDTESLGEPKVINELSEDQWHDILNG